MKISIPMPIPIPTPIMEQCLKKEKLPELKRNLTAGTVFPDLSVLNHEKPAADSGGKLNIVCCEQD